MKFSLNLQLFGGTGAKSNVDTTYQGTGPSGSKASGKNIRAHELMTSSEFAKFSLNAPKSLEGSEDTLNILNQISGNPNAMITIYRATPGDTINHGDWVFLQKDKADAWSKTPITRKLKPGYKVLTMRVPAKQVDWTGKNLEFMYI